MDLSRKWKGRLLSCVAVFFAALAVGYALHNGVIIILGAAVMCGSALGAERSLRCPACGESVFKQAMERGASHFSCPKCSQEIDLK